MNEDMQKSLLITEVSAMTERLLSQGVTVKDTSPKQDGSLDHLSLPDLRVMKNELRDLMRTLGGTRQ